VKEVKKKLSALIIPLLSVLVLSMFASTYLVPAAIANNSYVYWWDVYIDYGHGFPPTVVDVESNLEWMEKLDRETIVEIIEEYVEDGWLVQHYVVHEVLEDYHGFSGTFDNHFVIYWQLPWDLPFYTENYGYQWFTDGTGYFEGIDGSGEVRVDWYEFELPPDDPFKWITCQHTWGTINIGDYE